MLLSDKMATAINRHFLVYLCCLILLGNCGFQPLHGKTSPNYNIINAMSYVTVSAISDRAGQLVRNRLLDRLHPVGAAERPVFQLSVSLKENRDGIAFQQDDRATRFNLHLRAQFELIDTRTDKLLLKGNSRAIAAYNVVRSDYANLINRQDARRRAAEIVADSIQSRISLYFHSVKN